MSKTAEEILTEIKDKHNIGTAWQISKPIILDAMEEYAQAYHTAKLEEVVGSAEYWKAEYDAQVHKCNKFQMEITILKAEIERLNERIDDLSETEDNHP